MILQFKGEILRTNERDEQVSSFRFVLKSRQQTFQHALGTFFFPP